MKPPIRNIEKRGLTRDEATTRPRKSRAASQTGWERVTRVILRVTSATRWSIAPTSSGYEMAYATSWGATGVPTPNPKRCDVLQRAFPANRETIPHPMSCRNARSWPSACGVAPSRAIAAKAAAEREKTVAITDFASEPWGRTAKTSAPRAHRARTATGGMRGTRGSRNLPASEPCNSCPPELRPNHPTKPVPYVASPVGLTLYVRVRPFDGGDLRGAAHGLRTSWEHGADGLRVVPGMHDLRTGGRRGGFQRDRRQISRGGR